MEFWVKSLKKIGTGVEYFKWDKIFKKRFRASTQNLYLDLDVQLGFMFFKFGDILSINSMYYFGD